MNFKLLSYHCVLVVISLFFVIKSYAQPYIYISQRLNDSLNANILRINLQNNQVDKYLSHVGRIEDNLLWNSDQSLLFAQERRWIDIYELNNNNLCHTIGSNVAYLSSITDLKKINKIFIRYDSEPDDEPTALVINRTTYDIIDSLDIFPSMDLLFPSRDGMSIYRVAQDSLELKFLIVDALHNSIQREKIIPNFGPLFFSPLAEDAHNGRVLIKYHLGQEFGHQYYIVCDPDSNMLFHPINFQLRSDGYLTSDAKYVILNEKIPIMDDPKTSTGHIEYPGNVFIYDSQTGQQIQKLTLPRNGKLFVFDNYPNMLYYYLPSEQRSINIDLSKLAPPPGCVVKLVNSTGIKLTGGALQYYEGSWKDAVNNNDGTFFVNTSAKTLSLRMTYEYGTQTKSNVTVGYDTVTFQTVNAQIQLQNSSGALIDTGSVQYYAGAWRILGTTINGTAAKELLPASYSFRMTYAYASKDKQQDIGANAIVIFQTVNAAVQLQNSQGTLMPAPLGDQGTVQYYSGAWRDLGTTTNGVANKELLPNNYSFRMTYAYASKDKQQDIGTNAIVIFQTVNAAVQLQNSQGNLIDQGTVQYYSGAWRDFRTTTNGVATKELLPNNYSFRMTYAYASKDKQQDISTNATVVFQTVNATVQLQNSLGSLIDQGTVQYYSGAWRDFGVTTNGIATKELLPNNYSFRMTYAYASKDKQQDIGTNATVVFQTVNAAVQLQNSQGALMPAPLGDQGTVQYYSGAWRTLGTTTNGTATKELLPNNYSFRMTYEYVSVDKSQDLSANSTVSFSTVLCTIRVKNSQNQLVNNALASYYSGAWRQIGNTVNGVITKELLPVNLSFRVKNGTQQQDKQQNLSTNTIVEFTLQ